MKPRDDTDHAEQQKTAPFQQDNTKCLWSWSQLYFGISFLTHQSSQSTVKTKLTKSKSSFGTISSFATFPWNFFDKYEMTSLSQFCKIKLAVSKRLWACLHSRWTTPQTHLFSGNVKIWLIGEGHLQREGLISSGENPQFHVYTFLFGIHCVTLNLFPSSCMK